MSALGLHERLGDVRWKYLVSRGLIYLALAVITVVMLYPFYYMGVNAFRSLDQYYAGHGFSLASWHNLFKSLPVGRELLNSTLITVGAIALILAVSTTGGYAFAVLRYPASRLIFLIVIAAMMVPMQSIIAPEYVNLANLGFINHRYGAILVYAALGAPFSTFLMTTYFRRIPEEVIEAALTVLQFIQVWDDLLVGLLFLQTPDVRPITVGLATIPSQHLLDVPLLMAGSLISALPAVIVYLVFQRYLISGLTMGIGK